MIDWRGVFLLVLVSPGALLLAWLVLSDLCHKNEGNNSCDG